MGSVALFCTQVDAIVAVEAQPDEMRQAEVDGEVARGLGRDRSMNARAVVVAGGEEGAEHVEEHCAVLPRSAAQTIASKPLRSASTYLHKAVCPETSGPRWHVYT